MEASSCCLSVARLWLAASPSGRDQLAANALAGWIRLSRFLLALGGAKKVPLVAPLSLQVSLVEWRANNLSIDHLSSPSRTNDGAGRNLGGGGGCEWPKIG